jgi:hypothetical protein
VPIKLLLEAGLGIFDAHQCAQRSLECFGANRAGSDRGNASEILNDTKSPFCQVFQIPKRQQLSARGLSNTFRQLALRDPEPEAENFR